MGKMQPSDQIDYGVIVDDFDRLLDLYRFVEGTDTFPRICVPTDQGFHFSPGCNTKPSLTTASTAEQELDVTLRHNDIQIALYSHLAEVHGATNVGAENASVGGRVDIVIKTAMSARGCIRQALAQLLDYSYWPGAQAAERLIVIGEPPLDNDCANYVATLRKSFGLPIEYQQFNLAESVLVP
jgi:hypothetical protein